MNKSGLTAYRYTSEALNWAKSELKSSSNCSLLYRTPIVYEQYAARAIPISKAE